MMCLPILSINEKQKTMALPGVNVVRSTGATSGLLTLNDGVAGLIISGVAVSDLALATPKRIFGLDELEALGINAAYDATNTVRVHAQVADFYAAAGRGAELWLMLVAKSVTMTAMLDPDGNYAPVLRDAAEGRIALLGVSRTPPNDYEPSIPDGIDPDVLTALTNAQELATASALDQRWLSVVVEGRGLYDLQDLPDLRDLEYEDVCCVIGNGTPGAQWADLGKALGRLAGTPVQDSLGRRKGGVAVSGNYAGLSNGASMTSISVGQQNVLHDNGYIFFTKMQGFAGYYWSGSPNCAPAGGQINNIAESRVWCKAAKIAYATYAPEVEDTVAVEADGSLPPETAKALEADIERAIVVNMEGEISGIVAVIDADENVRESGELTVNLTINKLGRKGVINVKLGFAV